MISDSDSIQATSQANKHVKPSIQDKSSVVIESALFLKAQGWEPLWVPPGSKNPGRVGWQHERLDEGGIRRKFVNGGNFGIITGEPSNGLVDVDLDAAEANICADEFLPVTGLIHGRPSKPRSHRWYVSHPVPRVQQFKDCDGSMLVELRGTGGQTLAPPSVHPEGETLSWDNQGEPARLDLDVLQIACKNLAATALLARHWPGKGSRHQAALAIAGYFLRGRLDSDLVVKIVETAARIAGDEEWQARGRDVRDTVRNQASGKQITGGPTAAELFIGGEKVVARLGQWLQLGPTEGFTVQWTPPVPFIEVAGPEFPTGVFLGHIEELVDAQAVALQVPRDLIACLVIGTASVAASGRGWVRLNREWEEPLNLFVVCVLPSGERKSPAFRVVTAPIEEQERELVLESSPRLAQARSEYDVINGELAQAKSRASKSKGSDKEKVMEEVADLTDQLAHFELPRIPRLIADDATSEAVASLLADQGGRIAIMSNEGGLFETMAGRYSSGNPNVDVYLKGYSGDPLRVDRKSRPPEFVPRPALTLVLTVQPEVVQGLAAKPGFRGRGVLARFLYSLPRSMVGFRSNNPPLVPEELVGAWNSTVTAILKLPDVPESEERALKLNPDAHARFQHFRDEIEVRLRPGFDLHEIQDFGNKLAGTAARIAGILHLLGHAYDPEPWTTPISLDTLENAASIAQYFAEHAKVAFASMGADPKMENARQVWLKISQQGWDQFSQRDLWQHVRRSLRLENLPESLQILVDMGYLRQQTQQTGAPGRPRSALYEVNPLAGTQNPQNTQNPYRRGKFVDSVDSVYTHGRESGALNEIADTDPNQDVGEL